MTLDRDRLVAALPGYEVGGELGRGGWGVVLEGRHRQLGRGVAIKELPRAFAADPVVRARFVSEAKLLAGLDHPHIVPVYDFVETDGLCLLVMEKLTGGTLWSRFAAAGITTDLAVAVALATCAALHFAHTRGVLHRDIKPENLMFAATGALKVADFGIARVIGGSKTLATKAGEVLGTPAYMAPEQAQAKELAATDVYAAGVMLYELVSGRLPFEDDGDPLAMLYRHVYEQPVPLAETAPEVPEAVRNVVMRSLATDPERRFPTAEGFGVALAEAATSTWGPGWLGRSHIPVMAAGPIVAVTERPSGPVAVSAGGRPPLPGAARPAPVTQAEPAVVAVRPASTSRTQGFAPADAAPVAVAPLDEVVEIPTAPVAQMIAAVGLLLLALLIAMVGLGSPDRTGDLAVSVNGVDLSSSPTVELDLSVPVQVSGRVPAATTGPARVRLTLKGLGVGLGSVDAEAQLPGDGTFTAAVDAGSIRYFLPGSATGELELTGGVTGHRSFTVRPTQSPYLTIPGVAGVALLLFVTAYAESLLRSLRRGRKRVTGTAGMALIGALGGVALVMVAWLAARREPVMATVVAGCLLGLGAGVMSASAAIRTSRRRRFRLKKS